MTVFKCLLCSSFQAVILRRLMNHYNVVCAGELNFNVKCNVSGCPLVFQRYNSYYRHVRNHTSVYNLIDTDTPGNENFVNNVELEQNDDEEE